MSKFCKCPQILDTQNTAVFTIKLGSKLLYTASKNADNSQIVQTASYVKLTHSFESISIALECLKDGTNIKCTFLKSLESSDKLFYKVSQVIMTYGFVEYRRIILTKKITRV